MVEAGLAVTRLVTAGPPPAQHLLTFNVSPATAQHTTTQLCSVYGIFIYLDTYLKYLSMADSMGGLLILFEKLTLTFA